jgi:predicted GIY-YIG superfamily endonuclease
MAIYVIRHQNDRHRVKLGYTKDIRQRLQTFQTATPEKIELLWFAADGTIAEEKALHKKFAANRLSGEWFGIEVLDRLSPDFFCC